MLFHYTLMSRSVMNRAFTKALLSILGVFMLQSGIANAQSGGNASTSNSFVIKNTAGQKITFGIPSSGVTNYTLTFPALAGGAGAMLYSTNATGTLGWLNVGSNGQVLSLSGGIPTWITPTNGTVTSVGLTLPSEFNVTVSPITSSGNLTATWAVEAPNTVFAGPSSGVLSIAPTFRSLVATDIPNLDASKITTGLLSSARGGTGIDGSTAANGRVLIGNGTGYSLANITAGTGITVTNGAGAITIAAINSGSVTSVGLAMPSIFSVTNSPVTTSGTLTATLATQTAATVFAGPVTGAATAPTFRALTATDIPSLAGSYIVNGTSQQASSNFNITGNGTIDGALQLQGNSTGLSTFTAGAQGATNINYTLPIALPTTNQVLAATGVVGSAVTLGWTTPKSGTVTSVGLTMPAVLYSSVGNSPITTSGVLTPVLATQTAATIFAGPVTGAATTPTFRALAATDIPNLAGSYIVNGTSLQSSANYSISGNGCLAGQLQLKGTSTGLSTFQAGAQGATNFNYTLPITAPTANQVLVSSGGAVSNLSWTDASTLLSGSYWSLTGNSTTTAYTGVANSGSFMGTTSAFPLVIATTNTVSPQPIQFFMNSTERMKLFATTGFMTLGSAIASPNAPLHIKNANSGHATVYLQNTAADGYTSVDFENNTGTVGNVGVSNSAASAFANQFYFNISAGTVLPMTFNQNTVEKMAVDVNGNVYVVNNFGVGTGNAMNTKVDINGGISLRPSTSTITASGTVTVGNRSYIRLTHDATVATYSMSLSNGLQDGQTLIIQVEGVSATKLFTFPVAGNLKLSGTFSPNTIHSTLSLIWDGTEWVETARSLN